MEAFLGNNVTSTRILWLKSPSSVHVHPLKTFLPTPVKTEARCDCHFWIHFISWSVFGTGREHNLTFYCSGTSKHAVNYSISCNNWIRENRGYSRSCKSKAPRTGQPTKILNTDEKLSCRSSENNTPSSPTVSSHQHNSINHQTSAFLNTTHIHINTDT